MAGKLGYPDAAQSDTPPSEETADLATAVEALQRARPAVAEPTQPQRRTGRGALARQALCVLMGGVLFGGVVSLVEIDARDADLSANTAAGSRANVVFSNADPGSCLSWPNNEPDKPSFVQCSENHLFEVAESVDTSNVEARCDVAVRRYLGSRYDPNGKFSVGVLWSGDAASTQAGERHLLCGLQLPGPDNEPIPFKGQVAQLDQSKVWPPGTCLGIDSATGQSTDIPVDCQAPHALEVTGAVNLAERFPGRAPAAAEQDALIRDACTRMTEAYLAPIPLNTTGLVLNYSTVAAASWAVGSRQVSCGIGRKQGDQGWAPLTDGAKRAPSNNVKAPPAPPSSPAPQPNAVDERQDAAPPAVDTPRPVPTQPRPGSAATANSTPSPTATPSATPTPMGPPPGPPPGEIPSPTPEAPPAQIIEIPGLAPITLPVFPPPAPPPPPPPPPAA
jgi:hypothetical protein